MGCVLAPAAPMNGICVLSEAWRIQAMLGHKKLETTAIYAAVSPKLIQSVEGPLDTLPFKPIRKKKPRREPCATTVPSA